MAKRVWAYATIAGTEKQTDQEGNEYWARVDYEPGTEITEKFTNDVLANFLRKGTATLYDSTKTPEENAETADEENAQLRARVAQLEELLEGSSDAKVVADLRQENQKLRDFLRRQKQEQTPEGGS